MRYRRLTDRIKNSNALKSSPAKAGTVDENSLFLYNCMIASNSKVSPLYFLITLLNANILEPDWNIVGKATGTQSWHCVDEMAPTPTEDRERPRSQARRSY